MVGHKALVLSPEWGKTMYDRPYVILAVRLCHINYSSIELMINILSSSDGN